jgi:hypothetical protein
VANRTFIKRQPRAALLLERVQPPRFASLVRPSDEFPRAVVMLDDGSAGLDPISGVQVEMASGVADHGVVDMPADHPVDTVPCRLGSDDLLEAADEIHGLLHL